MSSASVHPSLPQCVLLRGGHGWARLRLRRMLERPQHRSSREPDSGQAAVIAGRFGVKCRARSKSSE